MITLNHSINLITEIDENKMPDHLLSAFVSLSELQMEKLLRGAFIQALQDENFLDKINENNSWAIVKVGDN
jgi:hypothetical protein